VIRTLNRKTVVHTLGAAGLGLGLLASAIGAPSAMAQEKQSQGVDRQLLQDEEGVADLSDEELKQLLIQLLQEKAGEKESVPAFLGDEDAKDVTIAHLQDGEAPAGGHEALRDIFFQRLQEAGDEGALPGPEAFAEKRAEVYAEFTQALADELGIDDPDEVDAAIRIAMMSVGDSHVDDGMLTKGKAEALKVLIATADVPFPGLGGFGPHPGGFFIAAHGPGFGPGGEAMFPGHEGIGQWISEKRDSARAGDGEERGSRSDKDSKDSQSDDSQVDEERQG
jgi:hypothetical protein